MTAEAAPPDPTATIGLRAAVAADFRESRWLLRLTLIGVVFWLVYEWGAGNETVTPWILVRVITTDPDLMSIPTTAAVGFAFTTAQQLASGFTTLLGFSIFDRTARAAWIRLRARFGSIPGVWGEMGWGGRSLLVFSLGTTAVALVQVMATGEVGVRRHARVIVQSAVLCGTLVGIAGGAAAGMALIGRRVDALSGATDWILRILGNPLFWIGLLLIGLMIHLVRRPSQEPAAA